MLFVDGGNSLLKIVSVFVQDAFLVVVVDCILLDVERAVVVSEYVVVFVENCLNIAMGIAWFVAFVGNIVVNVGLFVAWVVHIEVIVAWIEVSVDYTAALAANYYSNFDLIVVEILAEIVLVEPLDIEKVSVVYPCVHLDGFLDMILW